MIAYIIPSFVTAYLITSSVIAFLVKSFVIAHLITLFVIKIKLYHLSSYMIASFVIAI